MQRQRFNGNRLRGFSFNRPAIFTKYLHCLLAVAASRASRSSPGATCSLPCHPPILARFAAILETREPRWGSLDRGGRTRNESSRPSPRSSAGSGGRSTSPAVPGGEEVY